MDHLRINNVALLQENEMLLELSDGRILTLSLQKLLTLIPDKTFSNLDEQAIFAQV